MASIGTTVSRSWFALRSGFWWSEPSLLHRRARRCPGRPRHHRDRHRRPAHRHARMDARPQRLLRPGHGIRFSRAMVPTSVCSSLTRLLPSRASTHTRPRSGRTTTAGSASGDAGMESKDDRRLAPAVRVPDRSRREVPQRVSRGRSAARVGASGTRSPDPNADYYGYELQHANGIHHERTASTPPPIRPTSCAGMPSTSSERRRARSRSSSTSLRTRRMSRPLRHRATSRSPPRSATSGRRALRSRTSATSLGGSGACRR